MQNTELGPKEGLYKMIIEGCTFYAYRLQTLQYLNKEIFEQGQYDISLDRKNPLIIDCGGNIGLATGFFKIKYPESRVIVFEPNPEAIKLLCHNISINKFFHVEVKPYALGYHEGDTSLYLEMNKSASMRASTKEGRLPIEKSYKISVPVRRLSDFISEEVDLLKIDVEGEEIYLIQDLVDTKKIKYICRMVIEYHFKRKEKQKYNMFIRLLKSSNFKLHVKRLGTLDGVQDILIYALR